MSGRREPRWNGRQGRGSPEASPPKTPDGDGPVDSTIFFVMYSPYKKQCRKKHQPNKPALPCRRKIRSAYKIGGCPEGVIRLLNSLLSMHTELLTRTPKRSNLPDQLFRLSRTGQASYPLLRALGSLPIIVITETVFIEQEGNVRQDGSDERHIGSGNLEEEGLLVREV